MLLRTAVPLLLTLAASDAALTKQYLLLKGSETPGYNCTAAHDRYWLDLLNAAQASFDFDGVYCPMDKADENNAIDAIVRHSETVAGDALLIAGIITSGADLFALPGTLELGMAHLWIEEGPPEGYFELHDLNVTTSLRFIQNNRLGGRLAGREFCRRTATSAPQTIALIYGSPDANHSYDRIHGFREYLTSSSADTACQRHRFAYEDFANNWGRETARDIAYALFLRDASITAVVAASDNMALGVLDAAQLARPSGAAGLLIASFDHSPTIEAETWLQSGTFAVSIDPLIRYPETGLLFTLGRVINEIKVLANNTSGATPRTAQVTAELRLDSADVTPTIESSVLPFAPNMEQYLLAELMNAYDPRARPFTNLTGVAGACLTSDPTVVDVDFYVVSVYDLNEAAQQFSMEGYFRLEWYDHRLIYRNRIPGGCIDALTLDSADGLWLPDLYFPQAVSATSPFAEKGETEVRILPDGRVRWSRHARLTFTCPMNFEELPFDNQTCAFRVMPYSQNGREVQLRWRDFDSPFSNWNGTYWDDGDNHGFFSREWTVVEISARNFEKGYDGLAFSEVAADINLMRNPRSYKIYISVTFPIVLVCWLTMFKPSAEITVGMSDQVVILLIIVAIRSSLLEQLPSGLGRFWLDDYLLMCQRFVI